MTTTRPHVTIPHIRKVAAKPKQPVNKPAAPAPKGRYEVGDKVKWLGHEGIWEVTKVEWNSEKRKHKYELKKLTNTYCFEYEHRLKKVDIA